MKVSANWLKDYVPFDLSDAALADMLTMAGLEVEGVAVIGNAIPGLVVGNILSVSPHPNADRLTVCSVDIDGDEPLTIVCGAPNVAAGQKVPVATVGSTLGMESTDGGAASKPFTIRRAKIRGQVSEGMICAEDELGLSDDHAGIMVLPADAPVGEDLWSYLQRIHLVEEDAVLDVSITPNRPDATSHIGIARDISVLTDAPLTLPEFDLPVAGGTAATLVTVEIKDPDACARYAGIVVRNVDVKPSPEWLQRRLEAVGLRPRNVVVDITNFVMYECGQPLHAFDFDLIAGSRIIVRKTPAPLPFVTLDDKTRTLPTGTLMICDADREVAIAGVMGGQNSEVSDATTTVLIESAYFDPTTIRRTAKSLGIQTDASYRFERGVDPGGQVRAAARAAALMAELAGGVVVDGVAEAHPRTIDAPEVDLRHTRIEQLLGLSVDPAVVTRLLQGIGCVLVRVSGDVTTWQIPGFRPDIGREVDLIEEVGRLHGYDRIPEPEHTAVPNFTPRDRPDDVLRNRALSLLAGLGYRETYTNSIVAEEIADAFCDPALHDPGIAGAPVRTLNPVSADMTALCPSLLPGVLKVMSHNTAHGQDVLRFAEIAHVFRRADHDQNIIAGFRETAALLIAVSGPRNRGGWDMPQVASDYYDIKGVVETLLPALGVDFSFHVGDRPSSVMAHYQSVQAGTTYLGALGRLADSVAERFELRRPVYFAELNWTELVRLGTPTLLPAYTPVSRYPAVERDVAVVVKEETPVGDMLAAIKETGGTILVATSVFDIYRGEGIASGHKSIAFGLRFETGRTLVDEEVDREVARILATLTERFGAVLRGG